MSVLRAGTINEGAVGLLTVEEYIDFCVINNKEVLYSEYRAGPTITDVFGREAATIGGLYNIGTRNMLLLLEL
jgi:hypothetical protein